MKNELLTIGPFTIYGYGLMIAIGIVAGCLTAEYRARKQGLDKASFLDHRVEINCSGSGIYDGNLKFRFCGVRRNYRRDTDRIFVLQDQRSYIF